MCGITGFFETDHQNSRPAMQQAGRAMAASLSRRGPDDEGLWQDPDLPLLLGHRRLSIIDLSPAGHQPMESESGRYVIVYNGEIYNFLELATTLETTGVRIKTRSDTAVILAAFEKWGVNQTLQKLNGMFAFALWDRESGMLHLIRDRLGKKPLYIGWAGKTLLFSSELKALRAYPGFANPVNKDSLTLYMRYGCVPAPHCIYQGVWHLPAGCRISLDLRNISAGDDLAKYFESYWHHPRIVEEARQKEKPASEEQALETFERLLSDAVKLRMVSDVPLGAFLSGGIDSSTIVALMQQFANKPVKSFAIGFEESGFDEAVHARKIASHLGTEHHELYLKPRDALDIIPDLPEIYDEPFADISQIPSFLVARFTRQHVTVALSGDGGDELLGGYQRHYIAPALQRRMRCIPGALRRLLGHSIKVIPAARWDKLVPQQPQFGERLYKVAELLPLNEAEEIYRRLVSQFEMPTHLVPGGQEPIIPLTDPAWQPKNLSFAERMMYGDALSYLPNDVLTKVDRASMACSLEARAPLLDYRLFEYAWSLPQAMKIRKSEKGMEGKWLLRQVLARHVPPALFERPKQGFTVPVAQWLRGPLRDWAENLLDPQKLDASGLNAALVRALWTEHLAGKDRHGHKLWTVLMYQSWHERWQ